MSAPTVCTTYTKNESQNDMVMIAYSPRSDSTTTTGDYMARWLTGRASDLRPKSRGFEARPRRCCATTLGKLFTPYASVTKQYNLVPAKAGK